ncbi:MAG: hypothetical protein R3F49_06105 [Planctomycetota bacterium]
MQHLQRHPNGLCPLLRRARTLLTACAVLVPASSAPLAAQCPAATTERVSVSSAGVPGSGHSASGAGREIAVSDSGRFIAFTSEANNLVPGDTNGVADAFLHDRITGATARVSVGDQGQQGNGGCEGVTMSGDGRFVAFASLADNLVPGDANAALDVFLFDAATGTSQLVSRTAQGAPGNGASSWPSMDEDGVAVAFQSAATDLVSGDANGRIDIFLYRPSTGVVTLVSRATSGAPSNGDSVTPDLSADATHVAFATASTTFDPSDPNGLSDIYVRDLAQGTTTRIGNASGGYDGALLLPAISSGGRFVAFESPATNLAAGVASGFTNIYRYDRQSGVMLAVNRATDGSLANQTSSECDIAADGAWVTFKTNATNLGAGALSNSTNVYVRRVDQGWTEVCSLSDDEELLNAASFKPAVSGDGRFVAFRTGASNVVSIPGTSTDVYLRDRSFGTRAAGGTYCLSSVNSTGAMAETNVGGNNRIGAQSLILLTELLPTSSLGYYLLSETAGDVPGFGGSTGRLCLGGQIFRLSSFVQSAGAAGTVVQPLPFGALPPGASLNPGEHWHFQYWYRDSAGGLPVSNTSTAVCVPLY